MQLDTSRYTGDATPILAAFSMFPMGKAWTTAGPAFMKVRFIPTILVLLLGSLAASGEEPAPPADRVAVSAVVPEELPYGAGYEARQNRAQQEQQASQRQAQTREETQARERDRTTVPGAAAESRPDRRGRDRPTERTESRRDARDQRPQRGANGH
jgi:hypothetical protein